MMYKRPTHLENFNFNHVVPRKLGTAKGPTTYGEPLTPKMKKLFKELKEKRET